MKPYRDYISTKEGNKETGERPAEGSVGIVIPVRNGLKFFKLCFHSVLAFTDEPYLLTILDNLSDLDTKKYFRYTHHNHQVYWIRYDEDFNYAAEVNLGLRKMFSFPEVKFGLILNADTVVTPYWLNFMLQTIKANPKIGAVGPLSNKSIGEQMDQSKEGGISQALRLSGMCMLIRREAWEDVGGFDPAFTGGGFEDWDFCERIRRKGWISMIDGRSYVHHFYKKFRKDEYDAEMKKNEALFFERYPEWLKALKEGDLLRTPNAS